MGTAASGAGARVLRLIEAPQLDVIEQKTDQ